MAIGKTGNKIVDDLARSRARAQAEERRVKAAAKKASGKSRGGKFRGAGKAGRAAARRPAKGISAKRLARKSSGSKTAEYGLKAGAELINSNCGHDRPTIAQGLSPKMRPEIADQIERLTFSTPASSGKATAEQWRERVELIREQLGIDDSFSYCATRHTDAEHDHIHLDFNRVSDTGALWKDGQIGLRLAALEQKIEQRFNLKLRRREDFVTRGNLSKNEIERALREGVQPVFLQVQSAIHQASQDKPDVLTFVARLADKGIACRPNMKEGELNGFSYSKDWQSFAGKQLGANWAQLKEQVTYVKDEHASTLADLRLLVDSGKARPAIAVRAAEPTPKPTTGSERQMEITRREASTPDQEPISKAGEAKRADRKSNTAPTATRDDELYSVNSSDIIGDRVRLRIFPTKDRELAKLALITGHRQKMAQVLARLIREYDYQLENITNEFMSQFDGAPDAVKMLQDHIPNIKSSTIASACAPFKARQKMEDIKAKNDAVWAERLRHAAVQSKDDAQDISSIPTM